MKKIVVTEISSGLAKWGAILPDDEYQAWIDSCVQCNGWGLPDREVFADDLDLDEIATAISSRHVEGRLLVTLPAQYEIEVTDVTDSAENPDWVAMRSERDSRLTSCDYTQLADAPFSSEEKAAWAAYRQALRDLPEITEDPRAPTWPVPPS